MMQHAQCDPLYPTGAAHFFSKFIQIILKFSCRSVSREVLYEGVTFYLHCPQANRNSLLVSSENWIH